MVTMTHAPEMRDTLRTMFTGWILHEASYEQVLDTAPLRATRSPQDAMIEACGGDALRGELLYLFGHWSNDITSIAAHYGLALARRQPDGSLLHADGTVDTLMKGGVLEIVEIPPAPSLRHWWNAGAWQEPSPNDETVEALRDIREGKVESFNTVPELMADLNNGAMSDP